ncbi:MAG TPA: SH3 domain-containing protein [Candidatus Sulfomarinibacteraceae bacterium]|nr:SH3 domain-containing protein [Candidatus Sulfomarinibacteraceae bacterium]
MALLNIAILLLGVFFIIAAIAAIVSGLQARGSIPTAAYGVGRQETRRTMQVAFFRAAVFGILALILFGVYGLSLAPEDMLSTEPEPGTTLDPEATETPRTSEVTATPTATETAGAEGIEVQAPAETTEAATSAPQVEAATGTPTVAVTPTTTPTPVPVAIVDSEVGLYLRPEPGSTVELELLADGAQLTLLGEQQTVDDVEWQRVRAPSGNEGWVAADFITYQQ